MAAVASKTTPTTAIPTDIKIRLVETYPDSENRFNACLIKNAATATQFPAIRKMPEDDVKRRTEKQNMLLLCHVILGCG